MHRIPFLIVYNTFSLAQNESKRLLLGIQAINVLHLGIKMAYLRHQLGIDLLRVLLVQWFDNTLC
jgi:hypothetical protein